MIDLTGFKDGSTESANGAEYDSQEQARAKQARRRWLTNHRRDEA